MSMVVYYTILILEVLTGFWCFYRSFKYICKQNKKTKNILQIDYYKINCIKAWFSSLLNHDMNVRKAYILENTPELVTNQTSGIGYFSIKQIKMIANIYKIPLVVHGFLGKRKYDF